MRGIVAAAAVLLVAAPACAVVGAATPTLRGEKAPPTSPALLGRGRRGRLRRRSSAGVLPSTAHQAAEASLSASTSSLSSSAAATAAVSSATIITTAPDALLLVDVRDGATANVRRGFIKSAVENAVQAVQSKLSSGSDDTSLNRETTTATTPEQEQQQPDAQDPSALTDGQPHLAPPHEDTTAPPLGDTSLSIDSPAADATLQLSVPDDGAAAQAALDAQVSLKQQQLAQEQALSETLEDQSIESRGNIMAEAIGRQVAEAKTNLTIASRARAQRLQIAQRAIAAALSNVTAAAIMGGNETIPRHDDDYLLQQDGRSSIGLMSEMTPAVGQKDASGHWKDVPGAWTAALKVASPDAEAPGHNGTFDYAYGQAAIADVVGGALDIDAGPAERIEEAGHYEETATRHAEWKGDIEKKWEGVQHQVAGQSKAQARPPIIGRDAVV